MINRLCSIQKNLLIWGFKICPSMCPTTRYLDHWPNWHHLKMTFTLGQCQVQPQPNSDWNEKINPFTGYLSKSCCFILFLHTLDSYVLSRNILKRFHWAKITWMGKERPSEKNNKGKKVTFSRQKQITCFHPRSMRAITISVIMVEIVLDLVVEQWHLLYTWKECKNNVSVVFKGSNNNIWLCGKGSRKAHEERNSY